MKNLQKTYLRYQEEASKNNDSEETKASTSGQQNSYEKQDTSAFIKNEREQAFYKEMFL